MLGACGAEGSAHKPCTNEAWSGKCALRDLRKVEDRELPIPYVVYEGIYAPQTNPDFPHFTPAEVRMRFGTPAAHEFQMVDHLKAQASVSCHASNTPGTCLPQDVVADVLPFDAEHAATTAEAPHTTGCAAIDASSEQDRLAKSRTESVAIDERFTFAPDSSALATEATAAATSVAKRMADDPSLECVGVVGQTSPGESPSLAEARARAVKQLLVSLGVESKRLTTVALTASVYQGGTKQPPTEPDTRRVSLSVLLKTADKSGQ